MLRAKIHMQRKPCKTLRHARTSSGIMALMERIRMICLGGFHGVAYQRADPSAIWCRVHWQATPLLLNPWRRKDLQKEQRQVMNYTSIRKYYHLAFKPQDFWRRDSLFPMRHAASWNILACKIGLAISILWSCHLQRDCSRMILD